jgi:ABC-2 type transport system ATP-binding protein
MPKGAGSEILFSEVPGMIEAHHLSMAHGATMALTDASLAVSPGEIVALLGPNGAGKTTFLRILATALKPQSGWARICGFDTVKAPILARRRTGYLPEHPPIDPLMTVEDFLRFTAEARGLRGTTLAQRLAWTMERTELAPRRRQRTGELSKGYQQRVGLAQALIHDPDVLILDEPTTGLDPVQIRHVRALITELAAHKAVLFSTHILQEAAALGRRIGIIAGGRIRAVGTREELAIQAGVPAVVHACLEAPAAAVRDALAQVPGLSDVEVQEAAAHTHVRAATDSPTAASHALGRAFREHGLTVTQLTTALPDLETLFFRLTAQNSEEADHA